jgi:hypothetical protein
MMMTINTNRVQLFLAAFVTVWACSSGAFPDIIAMRYEVADAPLLTEAQAEVITRFFHEAGSPPTRRNLVYRGGYNCCSLCYGWAYPYCGISALSGYCSPTLMSRCRYSSERRDVRRAQEEPSSTDDLMVVSTGRICEEAKRTAMDSLMEALKEVEMTPTLQTVIDGMVLSCIGRKPQDQIISSFNLWDATTDTLVSDNLAGTVELCRGFRFNVEAVVANPADVKRGIKFELTGASDGLIYTRMENHWRYMLYGDDSAHLYGSALAEPGRYILRVTPNANADLAKTLYIQVNECELSNAGL